MQEIIAWPFVRHGRALTLVMAAGSLLLVVLSVLMTQLWNLHGCYLCMFQRLLFLGIMLALLIACWGWPHRGATLAMLALALLISLWGVGVAVYQSWLQWFPQLELSCGTGNQNFMEVTVEWLGRLSPNLFMATGLCEDDDFKIFWLSLANWAALSYLAVSAGCVGLLWARAKSKQSTSTQGEGT
ncbi:MAG: disulfide bond formation protein B [Betaproteobacteria bacterium ADurb.Bin341]|nr:MAG: disulfide bond formation protein B [Betaproteobacteria bacterium ADurb.Bin341]